MTINLDELFREGLAHHQAGRIAEADAIYSRILAQDPTHPDASNLSGVIAHGRGQTELAIERIKVAIARNPKFSGYFHNLGSIYLDQGRFVEAVELLEQSLRVDANSVVSLYNLASALRGLGRVDEAEVRCREALRLKPDYAEALCNLGIVRHEQSRFAEAIACYDQALRIDPSLADARLNRGLLRLLLGQWEEGWQDYESLWQSSVAPPDMLRSVPWWHGEPLIGRTIVMFGEQGFGDTIQFIRFAKTLADRGARVMVRCQPALVELLRSAPGVAGVVSDGEPPPAADFAVPMSVLPGRLRIPLDAIPAEVPYITPAPYAGPEPRDPLDEAIRDEGLLRVGIVWQGEKRQRRDVYRSIPLAEYGRLAAVPGVRIYILQKIYGREQLAEWPYASQAIDLAPRLAQFADTARAMRKLDLVISCDTAPAHLAGALSVPIWVVAAKVPDWRYLLERSDNPWYPSMRLFRQTRLGTWSDVFEQLAAALAERVAERPAQTRYGPLTPGPSPTRGEGR